MLPLITLILSLATLHFCAGGLIPEALYAVGIILNLSALVELIRSLKEKRLSHLPMLSMTIILIAILGFYLMPASNWLISSEKQSLLSEVQDILNLGNSLGLYKLTDQTFSNSLNKWESCRILLLVLCLPATTYLCAILTYQHKIKLSYWMLGFAFINILATLIDRYLFPSNGIIWGIWTTKTSRNSGAFVNPNHYGIYISSFLPFLFIQFYRALKEKITLSIFIHGAGLITFIFGVMLSNSRGAYLMAALSLGLGFTLIQKGKTKRSNTLKGCCFLAIIILFSILTPTSIEKELGSKDLGSSRTWLYAIVPKIVEDFPDGLGAGGYHHTVGSYLSNTKNDFRVPHHSENTYFHFLMENSVLFIIILLLLNIFYLNKVLDNIVKNKISSRLSFFSLISITAFTCHASYDYGFHIPLYAFSVALCYGLSLTRGSNFKAELHSKKKLLFSRLSACLPLVALTIICTIYFKHDNTIIQKNRVAFSKKASIQALANNLYETPSSWHNWYHLGYRAYELGDKDNLIFTEACFKKAALNFPNHSKLWMYLAHIRKQLKNKTSAKAVYRRYFLLQNEHKRRKLFNEAYAYGFTKAELDYLLHLELPEPEKSREFIKTL